jgi:hypothetical protein
MQRPVGFRFEPPAGADASRVSEYLRAHDRYLRARAAREALVLACAATGFVGWLPALGGGVAASSLFRAGLATWVVLAAATLASRGLEFARLRALVRLTKSSAAQSETGEGSAS